MEQLGPRIEYRTVPEGGDTIIGSSSKDTSGELFSTAIRYRIASPTARRNKRLLDLGLSFLMLLLILPLLFLVKNGGGFLRNLVAVLLGKKSWVGYSSWPQRGEQLAPKGQLPKVKPGVLCPTDAFPGKELDEATARRLDFFYAKDYEVGTDFGIVIKGLRRLGS